MRGMKARVVCTAGPGLNHSRLMFKNGWRHWELGIPEPGFGSLSSWLVLGGRQTWQPSKASCIWKAT